MHDRNQLKLESHSILTEKNLFARPLEGLGPLVYASGAPFGWGAQGPDAGKTDMSTPLLLEVAPEIDSDPTSFTGGGVEGSRSASRPLL